MDKEIEKIDCKLWKNDYYQGLGDDRMFDYRDKVILRYGKLIGHRKPKGKPRLLSDEEIFKLFKYPSKDPNIDYELKPYKRHPDMASFTVFSIAHQVAKAQLDICVNEGEKPPFSVGFVDE